MPLMSPKPKLLVMVEWFSPGYRAGGPIQSCVNLCAALQDRLDIYVLTTDTDHGETSPYPGIETGCWVTHASLQVQVYYARRQQLRAAEIRSVILALQPDLIYLNLLFSPLFTLYPVWLLWRRRLQARVFICPRGTLYDSALAVKPWKKKPVLFLLRRMGISRLLHFHATNEREKAAILHYFPGAAITVADNLPAVPGDDFVPVLKSPGRLRCIFIARIVPIKNLLYLLEALREVEASVLLTIVGPAEDSDYWSRCQALIARLPQQIRVEYAGPKPAAELPALLWQHHLFILPTRGENFGHAVLEALMAGRPVLISDQTPWLQLQAQQAGWDLPLSNPAAFTRVIGEVAAMDQAAFDAWAKGAWQYARRFTRENPQRQRYLEMFS